MRDFLWLFVASAALVLTACGGARPEVKTVAPAAAVPRPEVVSNPAVVLSTSPVSVSSDTIVPANLPAMNVVPHEPPPAIPADANFVLLVNEAVGSPADDLGSYTTVFIDGKMAGDTQKAPKSTEKKWGVRLEPGNHPVRFEKWNLPMLGGWVALASQWQPNERFIRIKPDMRAIARLRFYDGGHGYALDVEYQPLSAPLP